MIEALSIVGATGFALGAIGFLVTTLSKIEEKTREIRECQKRLDAYAQQLIICNMKMNDWHIRWQGYSDATYQSFWGKDAFMNVENLLEEIKTLSQQIQRAVIGELDESPFKTPEISQKEEDGRKRKRRGIFRVLKFLRRGRPRTTEKPDNAASDSTKNTDWDTWRKTMKVIESNSKMPPEFSDRNLLFKIAFALYKNQKLQERLGRLERAVANLNEFTRIKYRELRKGDISKAVEGEEIARSVRCQAFVDRLTTFASTLHKAFMDLEDRIPWALELRAPDDRGNATRWDTSAEIDLDFALRLKADALKWHRVRIRYKQTSNPKHAAISLPQDIITISRTEAPDSIPHGFQFLVPSQRYSLPFRKIFELGIFQKDPQTYKAWEVDRTNLIVGLANWTVLLWNTPWTMGPDSCVLRFHELQSDRSARIYTFAPDVTHTCYDDTLQNRKLLLLGIVLAELILATPIVVTLSSATNAMKGAFEYKWKVWQDDGQPRDWEPVTREKILQEVRTKSYSNGFTDVVQYCLDNQKVNLLGDFCPEYIEHYNKNILDPLQTYSEILLEQRRRFLTTSWVKSLLSGKRWPLDTVYDQRDLPTLEVNNKI